MNIRTHRPLMARVAPLAAFCCALATSPVHAGLGEAPTVQPPGQALSNASARAKAAPRPITAGYTINEVATGDGGTITEYVSPAGVVFGISWHSPIMPDLHQLLGSYFPTFEQAAVASRSTGRRGPIGIDTPGLVLQSAGRMRDYRGRAYVPGLLPPNVAGDVIR